MKFSPLILLLLGQAAAAQQPIKPIDFNRDVRSILASACFKCHGPDSKKRQADLRLDVRTSAIRLRDGRAAIVPKNLSASELIRRITSSDPDRQMPPADSNIKLSKQQISTLRRWIQQGAPYATHWSFVPARRPPIPRVKLRSWPRNAIDYFVLSRLESGGLRPAPSATRRRLIRRLSLDLTGVPPTPGELDRFLANGSRNAYEQLVDRLLASPRFGERMALHWLDAARYADTHGYHEDYHRDMWHWRSWVIRSFNANMPFNQFTIEQLAGDLLPKPSIDQLVATGFNRNHGVTASGISEEYRVEYVLDRVKTTATVWLGLTMQCAQCHDHKYDPISQRDFYKFFAYFNSVTDKGVENRMGNVDPLIKVVPPQNQAIKLVLKSEIKKLKAELATQANKSAAKLKEWESAYRRKGKKKLTDPAGLMLHLALDEAEGKVVANRGKAKVKGRVIGTAKWVKGKLGGGLQFNGGTHVDLGNTVTMERTDAFSYGAWVKRQGNGALIARMDDSRSYRGWDMYLSGGKLEVHMIHKWPENALHVVTTASLPNSKWTHIFTTYDGSSQASGVRVYFDGKRQAVKVTRDKLTKTIKTRKPLHLGRRNPSGQFTGVIDDARIYSRALTPSEVAALAGSDPITPILQIARSKRSKAQQAILQGYFLRRKDPVYRRLSAALDDVQARLRVTDAASKKLTTMVMRDMKTPRKTFVLVRGAYDKHGQPVTAGTPRFLPKAIGGKPNRLALAKWLTDAQHPLTSRVTVNRLWQLVFGAGIVKTSEDFGTQGSPPSHPELLDWLSTKFVGVGWDVKKMMKLIVMSSTYRQSAKVTAQMLARDPKNRLLARGARFRLPAEMIRDNVLAISGLLVEQLGGPSFKPYQPKGLWLETSNRPYAQDHGAKLYRRSLYMYWKRSVPPPTLFAIDAPTREVCLVRRQRTNTPLMALVLLNDPTFVEAARALAERTMLAEKGTEARFDDLFRRAVARRPKLAERKILRKILARQLQIFQAKPKAATKLLSVGESKRNMKLNVVEHAAWTAIASVILNLDETISRE